MSDPVQEAAPKVEAAVSSAAATVAADAKAAGGVVASVVAAVKKYAPHVAVGAVGYVAGHWTGGVVFAVIKHIL